MKINLEYAEGIPGGLVTYLKKNKRDLIMLNDLIDLKNQRGLKLSMTRDRHDNPSMIHLMQNLFHKNQHALV